MVFCKSQKSSYGSSDDAVNVDVGEQCQLGIAGIEPAHMTAERHDAAFGVVLEIEVVVALRIGAELRIIPVRR